jgi:hypothetical protein
MILQNNHEKLCRDLPNSQVLKPKSEAKIKTWLACYVFLSLGLLLSA